MTEDTLAESRAAHARHEAIVQQLGGRGAPQTSQAQTAVTPNADDLAWLAEMQGSKDAEGRRRYEVDTAFRTRLENARMRVCRGEDISDVRQSTERVLAGGSATLPERPEPAPPQGTPAERAVETLNAGGTLTTAEIPAELLSGYRVSLPEGWVMDVSAVEQLAAARQAGFSQSQIDSFIRALVRQ